MTDGKKEHFDEAFKSWAERPLCTPADEAARQVMAQLPERRGKGWFSGSRLRFATAAVGLALLLVVGWATLPKPQGASVPAQEVALPPLPEDVVLLWLDDETPLYLTVALPATEGDSR